MSGVPRRTNTNCDSSDANISIPRATGDSYSRIRPIESTQRPVTVESTIVDDNMASGTSYRAARSSGRHLLLRLSCSGVLTAEVAWPRCFNALNRDRVCLE